MRSLFQPNGVLICFLGFDICSFLYRKNGNNGPNFGDLLIDTSNLSLVNDRIGIDIYEPEHRSHHDPARANMRLGSSFNWLWESRSIGVSCFRHSSLPFAVTRSLQIQVSSPQRTSIMRRLLFEMPDLGYSKPVFEKYALRLRCPIQRPLRTSKVYDIIV